MAARDRLTVERLPGRPEERVEAVLVMRFASDVSLVDAAVELLVSHCLQGRDPTRRTLFRMRVAIAEALTNAIQCGNRGDPAKAVAVLADLLPDRVRVAVSDEGQGFDPGCVPDPTSDPGALENPRGRGLFLIRNLADQVEFNDRGNTIWMTLPRW